jgi:hypothetical protein
MRFAIDCVGANWNMETDCDFGLETAGASPRAHYSTASAVETPSRWSFESIIYWPSEFPLIVLLLIVAALLFLLLNVDRIIRKEPPRRVIEVAGRHK